MIETWKMQEEKTWADLAEKTWGDLKYMSEVTGNIGGTYVKYKVGEL